jgi:hypothetical protein
MDKEKMAAAKLELYDGRGFPKCFPAFQKLPQ